MTTLSSAATVRGVGIHTGAAAVVTLRPAEPGSGIVFHSSGRDIPARVDNVVDTGRCTVLGEGDVSVATVEHLLSACGGLGIDDLRIEVDGPELPIGDGSALIWTDAIAVAGLSRTGDASENAWRLLEPVLVTGRDGAFIAAFPSENSRLTVSISFDHPLVGTRVARFDPAQGDDYARDVAPARTFGFIEEVEALRAAGLAQGGSFDNAVVVYPDRFSTPLRWPDELARHKLLDLMGDFVLRGSSGPLIADIIAVKPSHRLNVSFAARLHELSASPTRVSFPAG